MPLKLKYASGHYQSVAPLLQGEVAPSGIDLSIEVINNPRELFERMHREQAFDVAEMSLTEYVHQTSTNTSPFIALPVFPIRVFPHGFIVVNRTSGIRTPKDLEGKRIGVPYYHMSSALYARGMLMNDHGVDLSKIHWVEGGMEKPGGHGNPIKWPYSPPNLEVNNTGLPLDQMLREKQLDATLGALLPSSFGSHPDIVRLFPEVEETEMDYYRRTGVQPINHLIIVRKAVVEENPWVVDSLFEAFLAAKNKAVEYLRGHTRGHWQIPWFEQVLARIDAVFQGDPWPYGVSANRTTISAAIQFMVQQGMLSRRLEAEELFAPGCA